MELADEHSSDLEAPVSQDDFNRLKTQHSLLENQLSELEELRFPTDLEEARIKQLKIEKLAIKEKLERGHLQQT